MDKLFLQLCLLFSITGCGGGGGDSVESVPPQSAPVQTTPPTSTSTTTPTQTVQEVDERVWFNDYVYSDYLDFGDGDLKFTEVTLRVGDYIPSSELPENSKFKTVDYNFLEITVDGVHKGFYEEGNPEMSEQGVWSVTFNNFFHATDINNDGHQDFFAAVYFIGARSDTPEERLIAMINDGNGHFNLDLSVFEDYDLPCIGGGGPNDIFLFNNIDPQRECGHTIGHQRMHFADFNNDGNDDMFQTSKLFLSNNGVMYDMSLENLPEFLFEAGNAPWSHDVTTGDFNGDGNIDVFMPLQTHAWTILENDGTGKFTSRTKGLPVQQCSQECTEMIWATSTAAGDFNGDGYDEIVVGWYNPYLSSEETVGAPSVENSVGAVYMNAGPDVRPEDQFQTIITLPANFYGANGNVNDMEIIDFDEDGVDDIIIATTKHEPYYEGRAIQFLRTVVNGNEITFEDVTEQYNPDVDKYANGSRIDSAWWNGEGRLRVVDVDWDGDLDIVDSNRESYVLTMEQDGTFKMHDDFARPKGNNFAEFYPIDVNGDGMYDFVSHEFTETTTTYTSHFFINLAK
jgi:hypothetical protein